MVREKQGPASRCCTRSRRAGLGAALTILIALPPLVAGAAGCGGRIIVVVAYGDDAGATSASDDASAGSSGSSGSSSSGGSSYGGSSGAMVAMDAAAASSGGDAAPFVGNAICSSAADCPAGRICCATENLVTSCLEGPCPMVAPLQFCATATECVMKGDTCIFLLTEPEDSYQVCTPPAASSR